MNTVTKALDSACNGIFTLIQFYESCTVVKLSASESGGDGDDFCSLLKKIYDQLKCKYKINNEYFVLIYF